MELNPFTVWFTGISGSGKTTLGTALQKYLNAQGWRAQLLDSGAIRKDVSHDMKFERDDIERNINRITYDCEILNRNGVIAIVAAVSPYRDLRAASRRHLPRFVEVFCDATIEQLLQRHPEGTVARARRGELKKVAGVDAPYEPPERPEVHVKTGSMSVQECLEIIVKTLELLKYLPENKASGYSPAQEDMIKARLKDLGYI